MAKEDKNKKLDHNDFSNKNEAVKAALAKIKKDHGEEAASLFADRPVKEIGVISTGSLKIDHALGIGGFARGRIVEVYGPFSSGKTTLALHAIAEAQKAGGIAAFIDAEHALDPIYAASLGVNMDSLVFSQPSSGEEALSICETLVSSGGCDIIVVDSVAALVPQAEIDGEMGSSHVGLQARLMGQACRKLAGMVSNTNTTLIFINQLRQKIGVMFGSPETTPGGEALKFYASQRLDIRRIGALKSGEETIGGRTKVKVVKNKLAPPFKEVEFDIIFGKGINNNGELIDEGLVLGLVEKAGAWYSYDGERIGQGRDNSCNWLANHLASRDKLDLQVRKHLGLTRE